MAPLGTLVTLAVAVATASAFVTSPSSVQLRSLTASTGVLMLPGNVRSSGSSRATRAHPPPRTALRASETTYDLDDRTIRGPLQPIEDTVMIKVQESKKVTSGGLFLPEMKNEKPTRGMVVAAAEGKRHWDTGVQIPITVSVGERVVYGNYDGTSVKYQGSEHLLMRDTQLLMAYESDELNLDTARMVADRVLLKVKATPKGSIVTAKGVLIAESATRSNRPTVGQVVKVGSGRMVPSGVMMPMYCEVGDMVKYKDYAAEVITIEGLETNEYDLVCIRNVDVLAKW